MSNEGRRPSLRFSPPKQLVCSYIFPLLCIRPPLHLRSPSIARLHSTVRRRRGHKLPYRLRGTGRPICKRGSHGCGLLGLLPLRLLPLALSRQIEGCRLPWRGGPHGALPINPRHRRGHGRGHTAVMLLLLRPAIALRLLLLLLLI